jgi:hypothetical protein
MRPSTGLSGTQFSTIYSAGRNYIEGPGKCNSTEVKYGASFFGCYTALDTSIVMHKYLEKSKHSEALKQHSYMKSST